MSIRSTASLACLLLATSLGAQTLYPTGTTIHDASRALQGNTLFPTSAGEIKLVDMDGQVLNTWTSPVAGATLSTPKIVGPNSILVRMGTGNLVKDLVELDANGSVLWQYTLPSWLYSIHHDHIRLANGNTLILVAAQVTIPWISPIELIDDAIIEVTPAGNIVWSWFTWRHYGELGLDAQARSLISQQGGDWAHANAINVLPSNDLGPPFDTGDILVSYRFTNTILLIDKATGAVEWRSGPDSPLTHGQHNPYMIRRGFEGAGNILVFDNGSGTGYPLEGRSRSASSVKEIDPTTNTVVWSYDATNSGRRLRMFYSDIVSNAQRLTNGNTLICSGLKGRLFEVTRDGDIVWEYMSPFPGPTRGNPDILSFLTYRAYRVPSSWLVPGPRRSSRVREGVEDIGLHR